MEGAFWGTTHQSIIGHGVIDQPRRAPQLPARWLLIGLARQTSHLNLYVNAAEDNQHLAPVYAPTLGKVKAGAASLSFANADRIDTDVLTTMLHHAARLVPPGN
ncbi:hypothetical protein FK268_13670 [Tsukamurella sputi]|uniref:DUF1801 domain-containing protein n=1 Tax=Tsukamurella sputi TaxID=2591848 RepID=A0A5C5RKV7_9ACTN|nr:hypothetical protein [Tsukamurella sputi]TWS23338.1 hypothetical protein FK268_13670 [Tsukamurella sputi]